MLGYSDLFQPDDSIKQLKEDLAALAAQYRALMDGIKSESAGIKAALDSVSSATSSGQEKIKEASAYVDKLAKKEADLAFASTETARKSPSEHYSPGTRVITKTTTYANKRQH